MGEMGAKDIAGKWVERLVGEMGEDARNGSREFPESPELQGELRGVGERDANGYGCDCHANQLKK